MEVRKEVSICVYMTDTVRGNVEVRRKYYEGEMGVRT